MAREVLGVGAVDRVPEDRVLGQDRALGPARGARGVNDEQWIVVGDVRIAVVALGRVEQRRVVVPAVARRVVADELAVLEAAADAVDMRLEIGLGEDDRDRGIVQNVQMLGRREPPVERHQHGAEARASEHQIEQLRAVIAEMGDAVAAADAEPMLQHARERHDAPLELGVGDGRALEQDRRPVWLEIRVALYPLGQIHGNRPATRRTRPARRASRGRGGRRTARPSTAASASRSGCRGRSARAAATSASTGRRRCGWRAGRCRCSSP